MYNKNYSWIDPKPKVAMIYKPGAAETDKHLPSSLSQVAPTSYEFDVAFKKS